MYKVYLSVSIDNSMTNNITIDNYIEYDIIQKIKNKLINENEYIVYVSKPNMSYEDIIGNSNAISPNVNIVISTNCKENKGINIYAKEGCTVSNGFAKEIYKRVMTVYYNKELDNGVIYDDKEEITKFNSPSVLIEIGNKNSIQDLNWMIQNENEIGERIADGIIAGSKLRPC